MTLWIYIDLSEIWSAGNDPQNYMEVYADKIK